MNPPLASDVHSDHKKAEARLRSHSGGSGWLLFQFLTLLSDSSQFSQSIPLLFVPKYVHVVKKITFTRLRSATQFKRIGGEPMGDLPRWGVRKCQIKLRKLVEIPEKCVENDKMTKTC